jgi:hypothetical protein
MEAFVFLIFLLFIYFTPFIVALYREKEPLAIFLLNLFLGWTLIGWVFALVWAATGTSPRTVREAAETSNAPVNPVAAPPSSSNSLKHKEIDRTQTTNGSLEPQFKRISGRAFKRASGLGLAIGSNGDEGDAREGEGLATEPALAHISYVDATGTESDRLVTIRRITDGRDNQKMLQAFCHMRSELRSFRVDRIETLVDVNTGEVFDDAASIEQWLTKRSPTDLAPALNGLTVLAFIAAADDHTSDEEIAIMARFASRVAPNVSIPADFAQRIARFTPDPDAVKTALAAVSKTHAAAFAEALQDIVDSDRHVHPAEVQAIAFLQINIEFV